MKFSSSALAASLTFGSAMAVPMNAERHLPIPACSGVPTVTVTQFLPFGSEAPFPPAQSLPAVPSSLPVVQLPVESEASSAAPVSSAPVSNFPVISPAPSAAPAVPELPNYAGGAGGVPNIIVVIKEINLQIIHVEELIDIDIETIHNIISQPVVDKEALLKVILSLKLHLSHVVTDIVPVVLGLKGKVTGLVEADLELILALVAKVNAIVSKVEVVLKQLIVSVKTDVLLYIAAELRLVFGLVAKFTGPIVKVVLALVANVEVSLAIVSKITVAASQITAVAAHITGFLTHPVLVPIFKKLAVATDY